VTHGIPLRAPDRTGRFRRSPDGAGEVPAYVFAKPPVAGVSKTRLAAGIGPDAAARLARALLQDTWHALLGFNGLFPVLATTDPSADFGLPDGPRVDQGGGDLGARLHRVLAAGVERWGGALAVGADSPGLPADRVLRAIDALTRFDVAVVPTDDGGFALLALRVVPAGLFDGIPWSNERTCAALVERAEGLGLSVVHLEPWFDIDVADDLIRFRARVARADAPRSWAVLDGLPA
jgi:rSAM/selenodomain-associated transferase 1